MLTFYPELDFEHDERLFVFLMLDCSNSMKGQAFSSALKVSRSSRTLKPTVVDSRSDMTYMCTCVYAHIQVHSLKY